MIHEKDIWKANCLPIEPESYTEEEMELRLLRWRELPPELRRTAVECLRTGMSERDRTWFVLRIRCLGSSWFTRDYWHLTGGRAVRDFLRQVAGIWDDALPLQSWVEYYVAVVEVTVREGVWHRLPEEERV